MDTTVIIPVYNQGVFLKDTLSYLKNQTIQNFKIIIVDDGSSDKETCAYLDSINDDMIHKVRQENKKLPAARNKGILLADTEYVWVHDADDYFEASFLEKALQIIKNDAQVGSVGCWGREFCGKRITENDHWEPLGGDVKNFLAGNNSISSAIVRKSAWEQVGGYDETMVNGYEDWDFWIKLTSSGWKIDIIPEVLFNYRVTEGSMVTKSDMIRPELVKHIVRNNKSVYEQNVIDVIYQKELEILALKNELAAFYSSNKKEG